MTNVGVRNPWESLALSTEASRDHTGLENSLFFCESQSFDLRINGADPMDTLHSISTAQLNQECASSAG